MSRSKDPYSLSEDILAPTDSVSFNSVHNFFGEEEEEEEDVDNLNHGDGYGGSHGGSRDDLDLELQRHQTRETIASKAEQSSLYRHTPIIDVSGNDNIPSGIEFESEDPELVSWDGPGDPQNPRNWSTRRKLKITILSSAQTMVPTLASSIMAPAVPNILADFHNSNLTVGSLMVSIMVLVWGFGSIIWAPLSESIGRRKVLLLSASFNLFFNIGCALSRNTAQILVFRLLAGLFNCAPISIGAGSLADVYDDHERQWPMAIWSMSPSCGPAIAPIISGWIAQYTSWRWVFWVVVIAQGAVLALLAVWLEETYPQTLLTAKKKKLIKETGNEELHTIWDLTAVSPMVEIKQVIVRPILFLSLNPVVLLLSLYLAFTYGLMYLILTEFPALWRDKYHFSPGIGGLMYLGYAIGIIVGALLWTTLINWHVDRRVKMGTFKLEDRLFWLPVSTVMLAGGMFWYGWSAQAHLPWPMPTVGIGLFSCAIFCVFQAVQTYIVSLNARLAGSASAAAVLIRSILGGTFPLFGRAMYNRLGYGWASTLVGLLAIVLGIPWPIGIYIYGPRLRKWIDENLQIN